MIRLLCILLLVSSLGACDRLTGPQSGSGHILVDTLTITVVRDETPGFLYPLMRHDIHFVGRLDVPGYIDQYVYRSQDAGFGVIQEVARPLPVGTIFRFGSTEWSHDLLESGNSVDFEFSAHSPVATSLVRASQAQVKTVTNGPRPARNSEQLTGPKRSNGRPVFSRDGQWIYFQGWDSDNRMTSFNRIPTRGGEPETLLERAGRLGGFALTHGDSVLTYVLSQGDRESQLVEHHLTTGAETIISIDGYIWDAALLLIPGTRYFISLADPNVVEEDLMLIDAEAGTVEILLSQAQDGHILHYDLRPGTREISVVLGRAPRQSDVILLDLDTRERRTFLQGFSGYELKWAPNGEDFAATVVTKQGGAYEQNISFYQAGTQQQLTIYPGDEEHVTFSPDGQSLAYTAHRRSEHQIWRLDLFFRFSNRARWQNRLRGAAPLPRAPETANATPCVYDSEPDLEIGESTGLI